MYEVFDAMRANSGWLSEQIREADRDKASASVEESGRRLERIYREFAGKSGLSLALEVRFEDVHTLMGYPAHTQLAYVRLNGRRCELLFDPYLTRSGGYADGFNFVQKCWVLLAVLHRAIERAGLPTCAFVFEAGDTGVFDSVAFCSRHPDACLILDDEFAASRGYAEFKAAADQARRPWRDRKSVFFWRGSTTGLRAHAPAPTDAAEDWTWLQRLALCRAASEPRAREHCDVGLTRIVQIGEPNLVRRIEASGFMKPAVARTEFLNYRYVFDIDGNSNSWSGLFCSLYGGACVLKVESPNGFRQWYYDGLAAGRNFVPVTRDLSDLDAVIAALVLDEPGAEAIAREGERLASEITFESALETSASNLLGWFARQPGRSG